MRSTLTNHLLVTIFIVVSAGALACDDPGADPGFDPSTGIDRGDGEGDSDQLFPGVQVLDAGERETFILHGDCNGDSDVTDAIADANFLASYNFSGGPAPGCFAACDANGDGEVVGSVTDVSGLADPDILSLTDASLGLGCETPFFGPALPELSASEVVTIEPVDSTPQLFRVVWKDEPEPVNETLIIAGDCDGNNETEAQADADFIANYNFIGDAPEPGCFAACDANGDGEFIGSVTDIVYLNQGNQPLVSADGALLGCASPVLGDSMPPLELDQIVSIEQHPLPNAFRVTWTD